MNNRLALALLFSVISVGIEVVLNQLDVLRWHWWWWDWPFVPLIVVFGYLWFFLAAAHAHDLPTDRAAVPVRRRARRGRRDAGAGHGCARLAVTAATRPPAAGP